ncbi:Permease of the drug/metabolite transporter (DMT) superfamily [Moritella sp. JT01]|uniref:DMT family transporter n=1 Tax=Moritella sp. JT01 TaxID=756698 RepID=UPI00079A51A2|nr:DMT family transporter [Moritella sp. JT01]KXO13393.1 Permease of the drug/metabolite transporter (DMT) superfamily [Moritella sp. JT01]
MDNSTRQGYLAAFGAVLIWSGFILVSRMGGISPLLSYDVIAIRYATCAALVLPIWWFKFRFKLWQPKFIVCSLFGGLGYALFAFQGFETTPGSQSAVLLPGLIPVMIIVLSVVVNKQKHAWSKWFGVAVITSGIAVLFLQDFFAQGTLSIGHLSLAGAAFCWGIFSVLLSRWQITPWQATASLAIITCTIYMPIYLLWLPKNISLGMSELWGDILLQSFYQGFLATIVQMLLYVRAVQIIGAANMGTMMAMVPVIAGVSALFVFDEPVKVSLIIAMTMVSIGVWFANTQFFVNKKYFANKKLTHSTSDHA